MRSIVLEVVIQQPGAAGVGEELRSIANETTCRRQIFEAHPPIARGRHLLHATTAPAQLLDDRAGIGLIQIDHDLLVRLQSFAVVSSLEDDLRLGHHHLVAFAAHGFDQHRQVQLPTAQHLEGVGRFGVVHPQRDVRFHFLEQAIMQIARGDVFPVGAGEWPVVRHEIHLHSRLFDLQQREDYGALDLGDGFTDGEVLHTGDRADVARRGLGQFEALQRLEAQDLGDPKFLAITVSVHAQSALPLLDTPRFDPTDRDVPQVVVVVQGRDVHRQRCVDVHGGRWRRLDDHVQQRRQIRARILQVTHRPTLAPRRVHDREIQLRVRRAECAEEVEGRVDGALGITADAIDLVHHQDRAQPERQRLAGHEPGLGHRTFERVDQQAHTIHHPEHAFDLASEVRVAGRIHDVDTGSLPSDGGELRENRDAALAFEVVRIHGAIGDHFPGPERSRLPQKSIHQGRLAVIDVRDDRDVADVLANRARAAQFCRRGRGCGCCDMRCSTHGVGRDTVPGGSMQGKDA